MIAWAWLACSPARPDLSESPPDVVVVSVDTLRADRLGYAGHAGAHTPALDALAASGRAFLQATTPLPRTTPALGSLHTGLRPLRHGAREVGRVVEADLRLAGLLAEQGWQTVAVSAMRVAGPDQRMDLGFRRFELRHDAPAPEVAELAGREVAAADPDRPLFLWVHLADPHFPYLPAPGSPLAPEAPACRSLGERAAAGRLRREALFSDREGQASAALEDCRALYDAEISVVDAAVGELLAALDRARGSRPRWVVLTADHGENQGEGGLFFEHGPDVHDASLRVPLVIAGPGVAPARDAGVARLEDLLPTLVEGLGLPVPPGLDGVSLLPRLRGGAGGPDLALAESGSALHVGLFGYLVSGKSRRWCLNEGRFSWCTPEQGAPGLFDHEADPGLREELSAQHPEVAARLSVAAGRWRPEEARQRAVRSATHKLVAVPTVDGWVRTLTAVDERGSERPVEAPALAAALGEALDAFSSALDAVGGAPVPEAPAGTEEALRALGYVE